MKNDQCLWRVASATPDLQLPSHPQGITAHWLVPNYTAWCQRHTCVNNLPSVALDMGGRPGFEPVTCWSQVQRPNHSATESHDTSVAQYEMINRSARLAVCFQAHRRMSDLPLDCRWSSLWFWLLLASSCFSSYAVSAMLVCSSWLACLVRGFGVKFHKPDAFSWRQTAENTHFVGGTTTLPSQTDKMVSAGIPQ